MIGKALEDYAQQRYECRTCLPEEIREEINRKLEGCTPDEKILMKFFYGTMPLRDAGEYEFEVFLGFVRHSLMLWETMEWCRNIPEEIFLHYVLYYRINSENIEDCRRFFYEQLYDRVKDKTLREAVLEINYWCAENAAYEASDDRTVSPLTMYRAGRGRCGEESTFAVTAFRSVGIPARQVYAPWWAHCDDNHAWVEVYVDGKWHFLGACEPEEELDRGWFVNAASRALMIHTRDFSDYGNNCGTDDGCLRKEESLLYHNITSRYAETAKLRIKVTEADGTPVRSARVAAEVLNGAEYGTVAVLDTDEEGKASLCLGLGTVHLWAVKNSKAGGRFVDVKGGAEVLITISEENIGEKCGVWSDIDFRAPKESTAHSVPLTKRQRLENRERLRLAARLRAERIDGYYREELAGKYPEEREILRLAAGNFRQIYRFLERDKNPDRKSLLHSLSEKDYRDLKAEVLETHLQEASQYRGEWEEKGKPEIYIRYILCPRIYLEELTSYREAIQKYFDAKEKEQFRNKPETIRTTVEEIIRYDRKEDYSALLSTPGGTLKSRFGNPVSREILCVAICRTLGIPARFHPVTQEAEIYREGDFVRISGAGESAALPQKAHLTLERREEDEWIYHQNWTIGQYRQGYYRTLHYGEVRFEGTRLTLKLEPGLYRIQTANRLPGGDQLASECKIYLEPGQSAEQKLYKRTGSTEELLVANQLEDFEVEKNGERRLFSALSGSRVQLLVFVKPGEEPTEHLLNEMNEYRESLHNMDIGICFLTGEHEIQISPAWERTLKTFPEAEKVICDFEDIVEPLARRMYVDPDKLPLFLIVNPDLTGIYGCSGYNVGSVKLILELLKANRRSSPPLT